MRFSVQGLLVYELAEGGTLEEVLFRPTHTPGEAVQVAQLGTSGQGAGLRCSLGMWLLRRTAPWAQGGTMGELA